MGITCIIKTSDHTNTYSRVIVCCENVAKFPAGFIGNIVSCYINKNSRCFLKLNKVTK